MCKKYNDLNPKFELNRRVSYISNLHVWNHDGFWHQKNSQATWWRIRASILIFRATLFQRLLKLRTILFAKYQLSSKPSHQPIIWMHNSCAMVFCWDNWVNYFQNYLFLVFFHHPSKWIHQYMKNFKNATKS